jgi:ribosomal protein S18 acetylase RimI-like enzyme
VRGSIPATLSAITVERLVDRGAIEARLRRDAAIHLYELGDLDDFFWPHTAWYAASGPDSPIALLYAATELPVLLVMGRDEDRPAARALLVELQPILPRRFYTHLVPGIVDALGPSAHLEPHGLHDRMLLVDRARIDAVATEAALALGPADHDEILALYRRAYPGNWFDARMLETNAYFGVRHEGVLVSVAGVHVLSRRYRVAALGNITTDPAMRGRGHARVATAAVCKALGADVELIGLNVESTNAAAIGVYRKLGFESIARYEETQVTT